MTTPALRPPQSQPCLSIIPPQFIGILCADTKWGGYDGRAVQRKEVVDHLGGAGACRPVPGAVLGGSGLFRPASRPGSPGSLERAANGHPGGRSCRSDLSGAFRPRSRSALRFRTGAPGVRDRPVRPALAVLGAGLCPGHLCGQAPPLGAWPLGAAAWIPAARGQGPARTVGVAPLRPSVGATDAARSARRAGRI